MSEETRPPFGPRRRYDRAPAPVKVAVSLVYVQMGLLLLAALAVYVTLPPGPEQWLWTAGVAAVGIFYGVLAYRLLQAQEWARIATIGLTAAGIALAVVNFQPLSCVAILYGAILIAGLTVRDSRRFFAGTWDPDATDG